MYFVVMPRVNLIVILVTYVRYLYSINCPTVICLPSILLFILWSDTASELWTPVQFPLYCFTVLLLLALFTLTCILLSFSHSIRSILCSQQTGEIDNLIEVGSKVLGCVVCRFHVAAGEKLHTDKQFIWRLMSTHASVLVDSVGPPSAEVCRASASFP
jgi:hypothetical protein